MIEANTPNCRLEIFGAKIPKTRIEVILFVPSELKAYSLLYWEVIIVRRLRDRKDEFLARWKRQ